jgi:hypothetical protein
MASQGKFATQPDELIRMALDVEDQYGVTIVARAVGKRESAVG